MRALIAQLDKVQEEKLNETTKVMKLKSQLQQRDEQLKAFSHSDQVRSSRGRRERDDVDEELAKLRGELSLREGKIAALTKELEIAHRSMEAQQNYRKQFYQLPGGETGREAMRTLYFDIGKKQAELHALTLALADMKHECDGLEQELHEVTRMRNEAVAIGQEMRASLETSNTQSVQYNNEITRLNNELASKKRECSDLQNQLQESRERLHQSKQMQSIVAEEKNAQVAELMQRINTLEKERDLVQSHHSTLEESMARMEDMHSMAEGRRQGEMEQLRRELEESREKVTSLRALQGHVEELKARASEAETARDNARHTISHLQSDLKIAVQRNAMNDEAALSAKAKIVSLETVVEHHREEIGVLTSERNEAVEALRQTMAVARDLSGRQQREREARSTAEQEVLQLRKDKNSLHAATLDALHREKLKTSALEKAIALIPLLVRYRDLQWNSPPRGNNRHPSRLTGQAGLGADRLDYGGGGVDGEGSLDGDASCSDVSHASIEDAVHSITHSLASLVSSADFDPVRIKQTESEINELARNLSSIATKFHGSGAGGELLGSGSRQPYESRGDGEISREGASSSANGAARSSRRSLQQEQGTGASFDWLYDERNNIDKFLSDSLDPQQAGAREGGGGTRKVGGSTSAVKAQSDGVRLSSSSLLDKHTATPASAGSTATPATAATAATTTAAFQSSSVFGSSGALTVPDPNNGSLPMGSSLGTGGGSYNDRQTAAQDQDQDQDRARDREGRAGREGRRGREHTSDMNPHTQMRGPYGLRACQPAARHSPTHSAASSPERKASPVASSHTSPAYRSPRSAQSCSPNSNSSSRGLRAELFSKDGGADTGRGCDSSPSARARQAEGRADSLIGSGSRDRERGREQERGRERGSEGHPAGVEGVSRNLSPPRATRLAATTAAASNGAKHSSPLAAALYQIKESSRVQTPAATMSSGVENAVEGDPPLIEELKK